MATTACTAPREPWNKGKIVGQKAPFKLKDIWAFKPLSLPQRPHRQAARPPAFAAVRDTSVAIATAGDSTLRPSSSPTTRRTEHSNDPMRATD